MKELERVVTKLELKELLVSRLSSLNKKKIKDEDISHIAAQVGLSFKVAKRAWNNFLETGGKYVDRRVRYSDETKTNFKTIDKDKVGGRYSKFNKNVTTREAGEIIKEYMNNREITSREISLKHKISVNQFYCWTHELNISGTLLGRKVLDPKKYCKLPVLDAIWLNKHPETTRKTIRKLSLLERKALERLVTVLEEYL